MSEMDELLLHLQTMSARWNLHLAGAAAKTPRQQYDEVRAIRVELESHPSVRKLDNRVAAIKLRGWRRSGG